VSENRDKRLEELFRSESDRLFGLAYRMLGSVAEAEDVVQDAFVRYQGVDPDEVREPGALLTTIATRLSIDHLKSARREREDYVGAWLPEPLLVDEADVAGEAERADTISMAFLVLLESLSPLERAVFASRQEREEIVARFFSAAQEGDSEALLEMLAADAVMYGDGGGKAPALGSPLHGRERVARALVGLLRSASELGARLEPTWVNGQPGARFLGPDGALINVVALDVLDGQVQTVRSVVNPEKLGHLGPLADVKALLRGRRRP
jgi:RNA polymerase sigma-70 factor (ECF subfamily)